MNKIERFFSSPLGVLAVCVLTVSVCGFSIGSEADKWVYAHLFVLAGVSVASYGQVSTAERIALAVPFFANIGITLVTMLKVVDLSSWGQYSFFGYVSSILMYYLIFRSSVFHPEDPSSDALVEDRVAES